MSRPAGTVSPEKGVRGFELDIHVAFAQRLPAPEALRVLLALEGMTAELYRPHPHAMPAGLDVPEDAPVPSARLTGPLEASGSRDPEHIRAGLQAMLSSARFIEVGLRGFLRSGSGQTEWMPWRKNVVLPRQAVERVAFEEGVKYVLE